MWGDIMGDMLMEGGVRAERLAAFATLGEIPVADRKRKLLCCAYRSSEKREGPRPPPWSCVWAFNSRWGLGSNKVPKPVPSPSPLTPLSG